MVFQDYFLRVSDSLLTDLTAVRLNAAEKLLVNINLHF